jgi:hypothetical protein
MRDVVLFPTATLPATPITNGTRGTADPRNVAEASCSFCVAAT